MRGCAHLEFVTVKKIRTTIVSIALASGALIGITPAAGAVPVLKTSGTMDNVNIFNSMSNIFRTKVEERLFDLPAAGTLTSIFGMRWGSFHYGIDIANPVGTPIYAPSDGVVKEAGWVSGYGQWIKLEHAKGLGTGYGHLNRILVQPGQEVKRGQQIAEMGNTGFSTGPHLHFEVFDGDQRIDPLAWMREHKVDLSNLHGA